MKPAERAERAERAEGLQGKGALGQREVSVPRRKWSAVAPATERCRELKEPGLGRSKC